MHTFAQSLEASREAAAVKSAGAVRAHSGPGREAGPRGASAASRCAHDFARMPVHARTPRGIQTKLTVGAAGDVYEQEADRVAEQLMRTPGERLQRACSCAGKCSECRTEPTGREQEAHRSITPLIQAKGEGGASVGDALASSIEGGRGGGSYLDDATRSEMEGHFGADFCSVKVHTDGGAARLNQGLGARAFTLGSDKHLSRTL